MLIGISNYMLGQQTLRLQPEFHSWPESNPHCTREMQFFSSKEQIKFRRQTQPFQVLASINWNDSCIRWFLDWLMTCILEMIAGRPICLLHANHLGEAIKDEVGLIASVIWGKPRRIKVPCDRLGQGVESQQWDRPVCSSGDFEPRVIKYKHGIDE